jgi:hypothetical protein
MLSISIKWVCTHYVESVDLNPSMQSWFTVLFYHLPLSGVVPRLRIAPSTRSFAPSYRSVHDVHCCHISQQESRKISEDLAFVG